MKTLVVSEDVSILEFLLATYKMSCEKRNFDWKEIGAAYYEVIGGSKSLINIKRVS